MVPRDIAIRCHSMNGLKVINNQIKTTLCVMNINQTKQTLYRFINLTFND